MEMGRFLVAPRYLVLFSLIFNTKQNYLRILLLICFMASSFFHFVSMSRLVRASYNSLSNLIYFPIFRSRRLENNITIKGHKFKNKYSRCISALELSNYSHLRDCVFLDAFLEAVNKGAIDINKGDIVMSKQAGLVMFNLKKEFPSLRFIDPVGLASSERIDNPVFRKYKGTLINKDMFLEFISEYNPKFIFDLNSDRLKGWLHKTVYENVLNTEVIDSLTGKSVTQSLFVRKK